MVAMDEFDSIIAIDWSGAKAVQTRAIAVAEIVRDSDEVRLLKPEEGGRWSRDAVATKLTEIAQNNRKSDRRTLVGIDANFSYGKSFLDAQLRHARSAVDLWQYLDERAGGVPNYYARAIWEHADVAHHYWHTGPEPTGFLRHSRRTEDLCSKVDLGRPESPFKLIGPKQVGKGGLSVMRLCHALRGELGTKLAVWPFDDAAQIEAASLVIVEIFPRLFISRSKLRTSAKLRLSEHLDEALTAFGCRTAPRDNATDHDTDALIAAAGMRQALRETGLPQPPTDLAGLIRLEGWIFGLPFPKAPA